MLSIINLFPLILYKFLPMPRRRYTIGVSEYTTSKINLLIRFKVILSFKVVANKVFILFILRFI